MEQTQWERLVESTFEHQKSEVCEAPVTQEKKPSPAPKRWLWAVVAAVVVIVAAICILPSLFDDTAAASIPEELIPCKEALDQWQALDSYKITLTAYRYGSSLSSSASSSFWTEEYWVSGEDWLMIHSNPLVSSSSTMAGYMYRDGVMYSLSYGNQVLWTPIDAEAIKSPGLWPMVFSWQNCEVIYKNTMGPNGEQIRFSVVERDPESLFYGSSPYTVQFQLNDQGKLQSVTMAEIRNDMRLGLNTFILASSDASQISQYIETQAVMEYTDSVVTPATKTTSQKG